MKETAMQVLLREKREMECFGTTLRAFKENACITDFKKPSDLLMMSMSIQSDCQELIERLPGDMTTGRDSLRQWLNLSKWLLTEVHRFSRMAERV